MRTIRRTTPALAMLRNLLRRVNRDAASLIFRQIVVAALFFLSNIVLMSRVKGSEFASFVDAQNVSYLIISVLIGGLQPTLMYFTIKNDRNVRAVLPLSIGVAAIGALGIVAISYWLGTHGGPPFALGSLLALSLMISSTFPFFLLAAGRISLFSGLELIPNTIFFGFSFLATTDTSYADLIIYFVSGHLLKAVVCIAIIVNMARRQPAIAVDGRAFLRYLLSSGLIGVGHSAIQRMPPLVISSFLPIPMRVPALAGWVLLDRAQTIQQSINLWLFQKNASEGLGRSAIVRLTLAVAGIGLCLPVALSLVLVVAIEFGIRPEYREAPVAILLMAPAFMSVSLRNALQAIAMSDGRTRIVLANVAITAGLMAVMFAFNGISPPMLLVWTTAALSVGALAYIVPQFKRKDVR